MPVRDPGCGSSLRTWNAPFGVGVSGLPTAMGYVATGLSSLTIESVRSATLITMRSSEAGCPECTWVSTSAANTLSSSARRRSRRRVYPIYHWIAISVPDLRFRMIRRTVAILRKSAFPSAFDDTRLCARPQLARGCSDVAARDAGAARDIRECGDRRHSAAFARGLLLARRLHKSGDRLSGA